MYLSLNEAIGIDLAYFARSLSQLRKKFPCGIEQVNYGIKRAKLELLWKMYEKRTKKGSAAFERFIKKQLFWLRDYALFKVIKEVYGENGWEAWSPEFCGRNGQALLDFEKNNSARIEFHKWLQWQLFEQFASVKEYAESKEVKLMGDLPFLVSHDSADVWAHQNYFKLGMASGAPPDSYCAKGQRWGMPPYHWEQIEANQYDYLINKLKYAENFFDFFRVDHFIGVFRLWTIQHNEPLDNQGLNGVFDPPDEQVWEEHGRKLVRVILENTKMLPCAEDLGMVPVCSARTLEEFGLPGMDVQRWMRDWNKTYDFKTPEQYRKNSIVVISTHDMSALKAWWQFEAGTVDEEWFRRKCVQKNLSFDEMSGQLFEAEPSCPGRLRWKTEITDVEFLLKVLRLRAEDAYDFIDGFKGSYHEKEQFVKYLGLTGKNQEKFSASFAASALRKANESDSIFSIQLLQDWLLLDDAIKYDPLAYRINVPGTMDGRNWKLVAPLSLEKMLKWPYLETMKEINQSSGRI
jgi:4-alpha-glucanotransferase